MNLDDTQRSRVAGWIAEGLKLSDIQRRIEKELGVMMTYMELRFLVDDLKMTPKDPEPPKVAVLQGLGTGGQGPGTAETKPGMPPASVSGRGQPHAPPPLAPPGAMDEQEDRVGGNVKVAVDQLARPGSIVSGKVTFSDGKEAEWHLDQMGRLGLAPKEKGYKPSTMDIQEFQDELQNQLAKLGF